MTTNPVPPDPSHGLGIAVTCDASGHIRSIIEDRLLLDAAPPVGSAFADLFAPAAREKVAMLLAELGDVGSIFDWELAIEIGGRAVPVTCVGVRLRDEYLITITASSDTCEAMLEESTVIGGQLLNEVRTLKKAAARPDHVDPRPGALDEFSRLNNELTNLQRELSKRNAELERSRHLAQSIIDTAPGLLYVLGTSRESCMLLNKGLARELGFPTGAEAGDAPGSLSDLIHPEDRAQDASHAERFADVPDGRVLEREFRVRAADGNWRWYQSSETVFRRDQDGRPLEILGAAHDVTAQKAAAEELRRIAHVDPLTGLLNRRGFHLLASQVMAQAARANTTAALLYVDVDCFKQVNDRFGHARGDVALQDVALALRAAARSADVLARVGGDEFVVLAVDVDQAGMDALSARLRQRVVDVGVGQTDVRLSVSTGYAICPQATENALEDLMKRADEEMYRRKTLRGSCD